MKPLLSPQTETTIEASLGQPTGAWLIVGPAGSGRAAVARYIASRTICRLEGCGNCRECQLIAVGNYPDLIWVQPADRSIGIGQIHDLQAALNRKAYYPGGKRIAVIEFSDLLTIEAQNGLLKLLEEPPLDTLILLLVATPGKLLPTVRSRLRQITLLPIDIGRLADHLQSLGIDAELARTASQLAKGLPGLASTLARRPEELKRHQTLEGLVTALFEDSLFNRLLAANRLAADQAIDLRQLFESLANRLRQDLRRHPNEAAKRRLTALAAARNHLEANVSSKVTLEALMLEL